jgi:ribosomal protein S3AE
MDIAEAFTEEAIAAAEANVGGDEEDQLREVIRQIYEANEMTVDRDNENMSVLCFVAGRTYQTDKAYGFMIPMDLAREFMRYLVARNEGWT